MARYRGDEFIHQLIQLMKFYPEYASVLELLIDQLNQGKESRIKEKLQELREEDWY
jgi:hypothetical protein